MISNSIGFVGGGRIARILIEGWSRAQRLPEPIMVSDPDAKVLTVLKERFPAILTTSDNAVAAVADLVFLAVPLPAMTAALESIKGVLRTDTTLISLVPKFTFTKLAELLGGFDRLARVIPNAPSMVGEGFNPICFAPALPPDSRMEIIKLLAPLGKHPEAPEESLEAYAVLTAMGPTYLWFQLQALREIGADFSLGESEVAHALLAMTNGAAQTLFASGLSSAEVIDLIPVKPLAEMEEQVAELYRTRLSAIYGKIKP